MKIIIILAVVAILLFVVLRLRKKKTIPLSPTGSACSLNNTACSTQADCCEGACTNGVCRSQAYPAFTVGNISHNGSVLISSGGFLTVGTDSRNFATWDGTNQLSFSTPLLDSNGNVQSISTSYISKIGDNLLVQLGPSSVPVLLNKDGTISSPDYNYFIYLDPEKGLMWKSFTSGTPPTVFTFDSCPDNQSCNLDSDCCGPFKKCGTDKKCQRCFGDINKITESCCDEPPCTSVGNDYLVSCDNYIMSCKSRCEGETLQCPDNKVARCVESGSGWQLQCQSRCTGPPPSDCQNYDCEKLADGTYGYYCEDKSCTPPAVNVECGAKSCDKSGLNCLYTKNGQEYIPEYNCGLKEWQCQQTCPADQCDSLQCGGGQYPKCDVSTNYKCVCTGTVQPDYCGSIPKPPYPDAVCKFVDESKCGGSPAGWRWYVESSITDQCVLAAFHASEGWHQIGCEDDKGKIENIMLIGDIPVSPTVNADSCRGAKAELPSPNPNINNPLGHVSGLSTGKCSFTPYTPGTRDYYQSPAVGTEPYCLLNPSNVCQNEGTFNMKTNPYLKDIPSAGDYPTPGEVISAEAGVCSCPAKTAGLNCEITPLNCSSEGYPQPVPGNQASYTCVCNEGYLGSNCQVPPDFCNHNGEVYFDGGKPKCHCDSDYTGQFCDNRLGTTQFTTGFYTLQNANGMYLSLDIGFTPDSCKTNLNDGLAITCDSYPVVTLASTPDKGIWYYDADKNTLNCNTWSNGVAHPLYLGNPPFQTVHSAIDPYAFDDCPAPFSNTKGCVIEQPIVSFLSNQPVEQSVILQYFGDQNNSQILIKPSDSHNASYALSAAETCQTVTSHDGNDFTFRLRKTERGGFVGSPTVKSVLLTDIHAIGWKVTKLPSVQPNITWPLAKTMVDSFAKMTYNLVTNLIETSASQTGVGSC